MATPVMDQYVVSATVEGLEKNLGPRIHRLTLHTPEIAASARPGQFVMVRVADTGDPLLRRPFSIHRVQEKSRLQLLFREVGKGTAVLAGLRAGDSVSLLGPLGQGFRMQTGGGAVCLVGGGMGVAPLLFLAERIMAAPRSSTGETGLALLCGARNRLELVGVAEFAALGVPLHLATDDGSAGHHGVVTDLLAQRGEAPGELTVYACGPHPMLQAVASLCRDRGWPCQVSLETMMACGIRACLGCAVPARMPGRAYVHVCKDGPVFDSEEVAW